MPRSRGTAWASRPERSSTRPAGTGGTALGDVTPTIPAGPIGASDDGAIDFDGTSGHVSIPDQAKLSLGNGPWSIEGSGHVATPAGAIYRSLIDKGQNTQSLYFDVASNKLILERSNVAKIVTRSRGRRPTPGGITGSSPAPRTDNHADLQGRRRRHDRARLADVLQHDEQTFIGAFVTSGPHFFFDGAIDEVAIYNVELPAARVAPPRRGLGRWHDRACDTRRVDPAARNRRVLPRLCQRRRRTVRHGGWVAP